MIALLACAVVGGAIRFFAPNPSLAHDIGTLLLVLWVPAIGNVIAFLVNRFRRRRAALGAFRGLPFAPQLLVELTPFAREVRPPMPHLDPQQDNCTLVVGSDGFTARISEPLLVWLSHGEAQTVQLQFLRPEVALPRLPAETRFRVLADATVVGEGRVLDVLG